MLRRVIAALLLSSSGFAVAAEPTRLDVAALRYYASIGQKDRVAAETRRLQAIDPGFRVPDDLFTARPGRPDEGPLWALYAQGRLDDLAKAVALRQSVEPGWTPSADLVAKIKTKELRAKIMRLAGTGAWRDIVKSFKGNGIAWAKDDVEALWIIAEAYARENDCGEAYVVYRLILAEHTDPNERRATIEHAIALIPMALAEKLIALERKDANGFSEFDPIAVDITRARMSAFLHDAPANEVSDEELKRFEVAVRGAENPNEPGLVAWYAFKRRDYPLALEWFKLAIGHGGDAMIAHGLAHTLRMLDMKRDAEEVAYAWRDPLVNNSILFIDLLETDLTKERPPRIEPPRLTRYAKVTMATESGEGAQALAWYAYNTCQYPLAVQWFERAVAWLPKEATVYGYALALQRTHRSKDFREVVNRYDGQFPKVVALAFDDGIRNPPPPCEAELRPGASAPHAEAFMPQDGLDWTGRTMADTLHPQATERDAHVRTNVGFAQARVPSPDAVAAGGVGLAPLKKKTDFPFAVAPDNPLRFSVTRTSATGVPSRTREAMAPLVARRVPGVGAMPYERYGFTLRPGWDGTREASAPTAAERNAPVGTLWALEQSLRAGAYDTSLPRGEDTLSRRPTARSDIKADPDRRS